MENGLDLNNNVMKESSSHLTCAFSSGPRSRALLTLPSVLVSVDELLLRDEVEPIIWDFKSSTPR